MDTILNIFKMDDANHHSLHHGKKFNNRKYNNCNNLNKNSNQNWFNKLNFKTGSYKEGFDSTSSYSELRNEYTTLLAQYKTLSDEITAADAEYASRTNNVTYNNKNIRFKNTDSTTSVVTYTYAYVTNKGIVKKFTTEAIFNKTAGLNGCPFNFIDVNIPWITDYDVPGAKIQTPNSGPKLVVGAVMTQGQSCGYEGTNVYVDKMNDTLSSRFVGCFDNTFNTLDGSGYPLGNNYNSATAGAYADPLQNFIVNGNFSVASSTSNAAATPDLISPWSTTSTGGLVTIVNSGNTNKVNSIVEPINLVYTTPYPNGSICVSLKNNGNLSQTITLTAGAYILTFSACGLTTANPVNVFLNTTQVKTITPTVGSWSSYSVSITVTESSNTIKFEGTGTAGQLSAIQNIRLTNGTPNAYTNAVTFDACQTAANTGSFSYFGFQNVDKTTGKGFCSLNSSLTVSNLNPANTLSAVNLLSAGSTAVATKGLSATLANDATLYVNLTGGGKSLISTNTPKPTSTQCYLMLLDTGTVKIYQFSSGSNGTPAPLTDTLLWNAVYTPTQLVENPNYAATSSSSNNKGIANNWIANGTVLSPGDFVGSPTGKIYLMMNTDGKLYLNTSKNVSGCSANTVTKVMEGVGTNNASLYKVNTATDNLFTYLGKLFFINEDDSLKTYPDSNKKLSNNYVTIANYNTPADTDLIKYNLAGDYTSSNTLDKCKTACNSSSLCYGYSYTESSKTCQLKTSTFSSDTGTGSTTAGTNLYVRKEIYKTKPSGLSDTISPIFSTQKQNYPANGNVAASYGYNTLLTDKRAELAELQEKIDELETALQNYSSSSDNDLGSMDEYIDEINSNNNTIAGLNSVRNTNLDNMLGDTDLVVLQENYKYLCWSILATASVLVFVNVSK